MNSNSLDLNINKFFLLPLLFSALIIPFLLGFGLYEFAAFIVLMPVFVYILIIFGDNFRFLFVFSSFLGYYIWVNARIQPVNIISYILVIYFLLNYSSKEFNKLTLPLPVKIISSLLITSVFVSAINTPFISKWSIYYSFMFFIYIFTGYVIFKSVTNLKIVNNYLSYFYKSLSFLALFIIIQIFISGKIRSFGLSGPTISDMIAMGLLIILFKTYISGKYNKLNLFHITILLIVLITTLSRFAWFGFISSAIFGFFLIIIIEKKKVFNKKFLYFISSIALIAIVIYVTGLYNLILQRILDVDLNVLDTTKEEGAVSTSLDSRVLVWITALNAFVANKFSGVGYFMFHKVSENYNIFPEILYVDYVMGLDPHSTFLGFLTETGVFGLTCILSYFLVTFILSFKAIKYSISEESKTNSIILCILIFFMFSTSFYSGAFTFGYNGYVLHFVIGLTIANYLLNKKIKLN